MNVKMVFWKTGRSDDRQQACDFSLFKCVNLAGLSGLFCRVHLCFVLIFLHLSKCLRFLGRVGLILSVNGVFLFFKRYEILNMLNKLKYTAFYGPAV